MYSKPLLSNFTIMLSISQHSRGDVSDMNPIKPKCCYFPCLSMVEKSTSWTFNKPKYGNTEVPTCSSGMILQYYTLLLGSARQPPVGSGVT